MGSTSFAQKPTATNVALQNYGMIAPPGVSYMPIPKESSLADVGCFQTGKLVRILMSQETACPLEGTSVGDLGVSW